MPCHCAPSSLSFTRTPRALLSSFLPFFPFSSQLCSVSSPPPLLTEWSNWSLLYLEYVKCCLIDIVLLLEWYLSNSTCNTSISGVKSSWTSPYFARGGGVEPSLPCCVLFVRSLWLFELIWLVYLFIPVQFFLSSSRTFVQQRLFFEHRDREWKECAKIRGAWHVERECSATALFTKRNVSKAKPLGRKLGFFS